MLDHFLAEANATVVPIDSDCGQAALSAFHRYGTGRQPAALSIGDCFAYACAKQHGVALLCKARTFPALT